VQFGDQKPRVESVWQIEVAEEGHIVDLIGHAFVQQMTGDLKALKMDNSYQFDPYLSQK